MAELGFVLEYSLGHATHADNLKRAVVAGAADKTVGGGSTRCLQPHYLDLPYDNTPVGPWAKLPLVRSNWSVRASLAAYLGLRPIARRLDAALFHTQVTSLFSTSLMRRIPSLVSLDATPLQIDALGAAYGHTPGGGRIESLKKQMNLRAFHAARHLITWSAWTKESLVKDYGVPSRRITVIPPGIDTRQWDFGPRDSRTKDGLDLLFVGGDFPRKGGETLLEAYRRLPDRLRAQTRLHLVTRTPNVGEGIPGVHIYRGLTPNVPALRDLYRQADLFVFPTRGDCLPLAVMEALAAGLPVVTTSVGALPEAVTNGETGLVVPVDNADALSDAITRLADDGAERQRMSAAARDTARERFDAATNYGRLVEVLLMQGRAGRG